MFLNNILALSTAALLATIGEAAVYPIELGISLDNATFTYDSYLNYYYVPNSEIGPGSYLVTIGDSPQDVLYDDESHTIYTTTDDPSLNLNMRLTGGVLILDVDEGFYADFLYGLFLSTEPATYFYACEDPDEPSGLQLLAFQTMEEEPDKCYEASIYLVSPNPILTSSKTTVTPKPSPKPDKYSSKSCTSKEIPTPKYDKYSNKTCTSYPTPSKKVETVTTSCLTSVTKYEKTCTSCPTPYPKPEKYSSTTASIMHFTGAGVQGTISGGLIAAGIAAIAMMMV